jgi:hypothetical protein
MTMADVLATVFIILGLFVTLPSSWLLAGALAPAAASRAHERVRTRPYLTTLLGLIALALTITVFAFVNSITVGAGKILLFLIAGLVLAVAMLGCAGVSRALGDRLPAAREGLSPLAREIRSAAVLVLSFLMPVLGWFMVLPLTFLMAYGAGLHALAIRPRRLAPAAPAHETAETAAVTGVEV